MLSLPAALRRLAEALPSNDMPQIRNAAEAVRAVLRPDGMRTFDTAPTWTDDTGKIAEADIGALWEQVWMLWQRCWTGATPLQRREAKTLTQELERVAELLTTPAAPIEPAGNRNYRVGEKTIVVDEAEDTVLRAFGAARKPTWRALTEAELVEKSGYEHAARILRRIADKHRAMAPAIDCPGKKGQGGLKIYAQLPGK